MSQGTLKAEMSQLRALLGGRLESRPYRIGLDVRCDVTDVLHRLRVGDVAGATELYGGELLPGSESPALAEFGTFVTVAVRNALLADPHPASVQRYLERTPYDLDLLGSTRGAATYERPTWDGLRSALSLRRDDMPQHSMAPMLFGLRAVMLGRQGSGKGTQGVEAAPGCSSYRTSRPVTCSARRRARDRQAGLRAAEAMEPASWSMTTRGVPGGRAPGTAVDVRGGGFVLDGFPRTVELAETLAGILADCTLDRAVVIDVPLEVARASLLARRVCTGCGRI